MLYNLYEIFMSFMVKSSFSRKCKLVNEGYLNFSKLWSPNQLTNKDENKKSTALQNPKSLSSFEDMERWFDKLLIKCNNLLK